MEELEEDAKTGVRVENRDDERTAGNLIWGRFLHLTARPVDGVPEPLTSCMPFMLPIRYVLTLKRVVPVI